MSKLEELYKNSDKYTHCSYNEWLYDFGLFINDNLSDYEKCLIYNEIAQNRHYAMWDNIDDISEIFGHDFLHVYSLIDHDRFNIYDDIIFEEECLIVSYTYADFISEYWDIEDIVTYISKFGLENLINKDLILDKID